MVYKHIHNNLRHPRVMCSSSSVTTHLCLFPLSTPQHTSTHSSTPGVSDLCANDSLGVQTLKWWTRCCCYTRHGHPSFSSVAVLLHAKFTSIELPHLRPGDTVYANTWGSNRTMSTLKFCNISDLRTHLAYCYFYIAMFSVPDGSLNAVLYAWNTTRDMLKS